MIFSLPDSQLFVVGERPRRESGFCFAENDSTCERSMSFVGVDKTEEIGSAVVDTSWNFM